MQRIFHAIAFTLFFAGFLVHMSAQTRHVHGWGHNNYSVNTNQEAPGDSCDDHFNVQFDGQDVYTSEDSKTLAPAQYAQGLTVEAAHNGGVLVRGWDKNEVLVKVCKAVAADSDGEAKDRLAQLKMNIDGANISASGPSDSDRDWVVHFLINVPKNIKLSLNAHNGPLDIRDVDGTISATTVNGPVGLHRCSGQITAEATNGPVNVVRSSGRINVRTQNGPLDIELAGTQWSGEGLEARAQNGPIKLRIPTNYKSGVEVSSRGYSPFHCASDACSGAIKDWDDHNKMVRLGSQPVVIRMSTVNGPVSIASTMQ